jgi:hypothetical protein
MSLVKHNSGHEDHNHRIGPKDRSLHDAPMHGPAVQRSFLADGSFLGAADLLVTFSSRRYISIRLPYDGLASSARSNRNTHGHHLSESASWFVI